MKVALKSKWRIARLSSLRTASVYTPIASVVTTGLLIFLITRKLSAGNIQIMLGDGCLIIYICLLLLISFYNYSLLCLVFTNFNTNELTSDIFLEIDNDHVKGSFSSQQAREAGISISSIKRIEIGGLPYDTSSLPYDLGHYCDADEIYKMMNKMYFYVNTGECLELDSWFVFEEKSLDEFLGILRQEGVQVVYFQHPE